MGDKKGAGGDRPSKSGFTSQLTSISKKAVHQMRAGPDGGDRDKKGGKSAPLSKRKEKKEAAATVEKRKHPIKQAKKSFKSKAKFKRRK